MSDRERARRVRDVFEQVVDAAPGARDAELAALCAGDPALRAAVEALLRAHDAARTGDLLGPSASSLAGALAWSGRRVGPYRVLRALGEGGMGVVLLAVRDGGATEPAGASAPPDVPGGAVALKLVRLGGEAPRELAERLAVERRALARLDHPNVARLVDAGVADDGTPYLAMEYVDGEPIDAYCGRRRLPVRARLALLETVCRAVQHAHERGVLHRDLKPSNVLVAHDGTPKLVDFGIAKLAGPSRTAGVPALTGTGPAPHTPAYASPEQLRGEPATARSDVYALGVLLHELVVGHRPFDGSDRPPRTPAAAGEPGAEAPDDAVHTPGTARDPDLDAVIARALALAPAERYRSAAALADDLARHLAGRRVRARRRLPRVLHATWARALAAGALVGVGAVGGIWIFGRGAAASAGLAAADLVRVNGGIDCRGQTPPPRVAAGLVRASRPQPGELSLTVLLTDGAPGQTYTIEVFERTGRCGGDNLANTGDTLHADAAGNGAARVALRLPHRSLGGETLGDGRGSETAVVVLDDSRSRANGDRFVAVVALPPTEAAAPGGERVVLLAEAGHAATRQDYAGAERRYAALVTRDPADAEAWFALADFRIHHGPAFGSPVVRADGPIGRARALRPRDPDFMLHAAIVAGHAGRRGEMAALLDTLATLDPSNGVRLYANALRALGLGDAAAAQELAAELRGAGDDLLVQALHVAPLYLASPAAVERLATLLTEPPRAPAVRAAGWLASADAALARGRWAEAHERIARAAQLAPGHATELRAYYAALPYAPLRADALRALRDALERTEPGEAPSGPPLPSFGPEERRAYRLYLRALLELRLGDTAAVGRTAERLAGDAWPAAARPMAGALARDVRAHLAWRARRPADALALLEPTPEVDHVAALFGRRVHERLLRAEALRALGRDEEALGWYESIAAQWTTELPYAVPALLGAGEVLERLGRRDEAAARYARAAELWRQCDPELLAWRVAAERGLARVAGGRPAGAGR